MVHAGSSVMEEVGSLSREWGYSSRIGVKWSINYNWLAVQQGMRVRVKQQGWYNVVC